MNRNQRFRSAGDNEIIHCDWLSSARYVNYPLLNKITNTSAYLVDVIRNSAISAPIEDSVAKQLKLRIIR